MEQSNFTNEVCNLTPGVRDVLKIFWKKGEIAHHEQFLLLTTIFCFLLLDFHVKTGTRFSPRDKRLFEINEVEITRVDCINVLKIIFSYVKWQNMLSYTHIVSDLQYNSGILETLKPI